MTDAERQKRRYDRKRAGLVRIEAWVPADKADVARDVLADIVAWDKWERVTMWGVDVDGVREARDVITKTRLTPPEK
jgi:hypothetical protein